MRKIPIVNNEIYHIYNRGASKMKIFISDKDYQRFINKIYQYKEKNLVNILAFCLMPNHFHLILTGQNEKANIPLFMRNIQCSHSVYFNSCYNHSGHVFQGTYKNKIVTTDEQISTLLKYILRNPVRKKLVSKIKDWKYSQILDRQKLIDLGAIDY